MRFGYGFAAASLIAGLFVLGRTPYAVGLIPSPWDKLVHVLVFALLTLLLSYTLGARAARLAVILALAVGIADEAHQMFLPGRSSDVTDFMADMFGVALAAWVLRQKQKD
jgi:VanZ family protein